MEQKRMNRVPKGQTMTVSIDEVQAMQTGYEGRIAHQVGVINRLQDMLGTRTDQLAFQMQEENRRAAEWGSDPVEEIRVVDRTQVRYTEDDADAVTQLWRLVPKDWDLYNEDDNQATALAGYIKWLQEEVDHQKGKQIALADQKADLKEQLDEANVNLARAIADLRQARVDARHNAQVANSKPTVVQMDDPDSPPWLQAGHVSPRSMVVPTTLDRNTATPTVDPAAGESETVEFNGFGGSAMPPGEARPGGF